jgi:hypothetical protein
MIVGERARDALQVGCYEEPHMLLAGSYMHIQPSFAFEGRFAKFEIVRKLGWGWASTVWLARVFEYV